MPSTGFVLANGGSGTGWTNPGNISAADNSDASFTTTGVTPTNDLVSTSHTLSIPGGSTIDGIEVRIELAAGAPESFRENAQTLWVRKNGTKSTSSFNLSASTTFLSTTDTQFTVGGATELWGETWSDTDAFTVAFQATPAEDDKTINVDAIWINVHYSAGGSDSTPDQFTFNDLTNQALSTQIESNVETITGINTSSTVSITTTDGMEYRINGGAYTSASGSVVVNDTVQLRVTTSGSFSTAVSGTLDIGGVTDIWTVTTGAQDTVPDAFSFTDQTGQLLSTLTTSNTITVSGINDTTALSLTTTDGMEYQKNAEPWTAVAGTVVNGDQITLRVTSSASFNTAVSGTLDIGGVTDVWSVTTEAQDTTPDAFNFNDQGNQPLSTLTTSNTITVSGINDSTAISLTTTDGMEYQKNAEAWTAGAGTVVNGDTVTLRVTTSALNSTAVSGTLDIGGVTDTWIATTLSGGGAELSINNDRVFDPLASIHIQWMGTGTLEVTNINGGNASIGSTPNGGTIVFLNPSQLTINNLANNTDVVITLPGTETEVISELDIISGTFSESIGVASVDISLLVDNQKYRRFNSVDMSSDVTIDAGQIFDNNFFNP